MSRGQRRWLYWLPTLAVLVLVSARGAASPYLIAHSEALYGNYQSTFYFEGRAPVYLDPVALGMLTAYVPEGYVMVDLGAGVISEIDANALRTEVLGERDSQWNNILNVVSDGETVVLFDFASMLENRLLSWSFRDGTRYWINLSRDWGGIAIAAPAFVGYLADGDSDGIIDFVDSCAGIADASNANFDRDNEGDVCDDDDDNDMLPDAWEALYGLNGFDPSDASGDLDSDGLLNSEEFENGTDPSVALGSGDVNHDGVTDLIDLLLATRHVLGEALLDDSAVHAADLYPADTGDKKLGVEDMGVLQSMLLNR